MSKYFVEYYAYTESGSVKTKQISIIELGYNELNIGLIERKLKDLSISQVCSVDLISINKL